ncbi:unnamed protein product [Fraxinus pennsylvanica]|uniref:Uncharacterized protein n=1 Tax=Fraxinus pennsylvanica TaxID=56036 RepID=A0AAD1YRD5_9LAMI|nr:unnamed protein product [Fraxinus pennsylvanica]
MEIRWLVKRYCVYVMSGISCHSLEAQFSVLPLQEPTSRAQRHKVVSSCVHEDTMASEEILCLCNGRNFLSFFRSTIPCLAASRANLLCMKTRAHRDTMASEEIPCLYNGRNFLSFFRSTIPFLATSRANFLCSEEHTYRNLASKVPNPLD